MRILSLRSWSLFLLVFVSSVACHNRDAIRRDMAEKYAEFQSFRHQYHYEIVKAKSDQKGYFVIKLYNDWGNEFYLALRYDGWDLNTEIDNDWVQAGYVNGNVVPVNPANGNNFTSGDGRLFEISELNFKDLEKMAGLKQLAEVTQASQLLQESYGLSESRSLELARLHYNFQRIQSRRELTEQDWDNLFGQLTGFSVEDWLKGQSDSRKLEQLIQKAQELNGLSPEQTAYFLESFL